MHNQGTMPRPNASGQILVLVLLVVLIGMSIGLSIASRTLTTFKDTSSLNQSNRAFSAAEAGVENALQRIASGQNCTGTACDLTSTDISGIDAVKVTQTSLGGSSAALVNRDLARDAVLQADLTGYATSGGSNVTVYWGKDAHEADACDNSGLNDSAVVISVVYQITAGALNGQYNMAKFAYDECSSEHGSNNFSNAASNPGISPAILTQDGSINNFRAAISIPVTYAAGLSAHVPAGVTSIDVKLIRVRLMYGEDSDQVAIAPSGVNLPAQGVQITSTAKTGNIQRTVKVLRQNNVLPAIFDYALFNGSTSSLTK